MRRNAKICLIIGHQEPVASWWYTHEIRFQSVANFGSIITRKPWYLVFEIFLIFHTKLSSPNYQYEWTTKNNSWIIFLCYAFTLSTWITHTKFGCNRAIQSREMSRRFKRQNYVHTLILGVPPLSPPQYDLFLHLSPSLMIFSFILGETALIYVSPTQISKLFTNLFGKYSYLNKLNQKVWT